MDYETSKELGYNNRDDSAHIYSDMILARKELQNAVITSDLLQILEKVATNREIKSIMALKVNAAVFYSKKDRIEDIDKRADVVLRDKGELDYDEEQQAVVDTRTQAWTTLPLSDFLGKLLERRKELKHQAKYEQDIEVKNRLEALQQTIKLIINTTYGCIASPYFKVNNTVLANNITGRCRAAMRMLAKALFTRKEIETLRDEGVLQVFQPKEK